MTKHRQKDLLGDASAATPAATPAAGSVADPVAGIDEAGRGCLAGPVVAAAVILPPGFDPAQLPGLGDSKALSAARREELAPRIRNVALAWSLGLAWPGEIDRVNILAATLRAMARAAALLKVRPALLLIDGNKTCPAPLPQRAIVGGDALVPAISAASILAKTFRDRLLAALDRRHPGYGFAGHKGYGAATHFQALRKLGPCRQHRLTFRGVLPEEERLALLAGLRQKPASKETQPCLPGISL